MKDKMIIPITIILASLIIGGFYYATQINKQNSIERQQLIKIESQKQLKEAEQEDVELYVGDKFYLDNGRELTIVEVSVGNFYKTTQLRSLSTGEKGMWKAQISIRVHSDNGPLTEEEYNKMYITQNNQKIKLSNSGGAHWGQYWFEMPKTDDFENMKLHFNDEATINLRPYIKVNDL